MVAISREGRWLQVDLREPHRVLSWAPVGGGFAVARTVVWRQVDDADLSHGVDAVEWLHRRLDERGLAGVVAMLTARNLDGVVHGHTAADGVRATAVATAGLTNAGRIGQPLGGHGPGTINILCVVDVTLTDAALVELVSIVASARTAGIMDQRWSLDGGAPVTGTGTDCIVVACPQGERQWPYAGMHTAVGEAAGRVVYDQVYRAAADWLGAYRGLSRAG